MAPENKHKYDCLLNVLSVYLLPVSSVIILNLHQKSEMSLYSNFFPILIKKEISFVAMFYHLIWPLYISMTWLSEDHWIIYHFIEKMFSLQCRNSSVCQGPAGHVHL